jgi:hypothetical protein
MRSGFKTPMMDAADSALTEFQQEWATVYGDGDPLDIPPSALLAALMHHADYEGWDFDAAVQVAREHGAATCTEISATAQEASTA